MSKIGNVWRSKRIGLAIKIASHGLAITTSSLRSDRVNANSKQLIKKQNDLSNEVHFLNDNLQMDKVPHHKIKEKVIIKYKRIEKRHHNI